jgi:tetratricopeptide (TPR) repeat protein
LNELYRHASTPVEMLRSLGWAEIAARIEKDSPAMFQARKEVLAGYAGFVKGEARDATARFEEALAVSPKDYNATYLLAKLSYGLGQSLKDAQRLGEATRAYQKSVQTIEKFISGDRASLSDHFDLEVTYVMAQLDLGIMALKADRLTEAAAAFERSVSGEVQYAVAHNNLGIVYDRTGNYDAALNQYRRATELNPNLVSARMNLGNTLLRQKHYPEAIESYRQVQKLKPDFALTHYNLGAVYFEQSQWEQAEKEWMRALELDPDFSQAQTRLDLVRKEMTPL